MKKLSLFCKIEKSCPNFDFVFREIAKMSPKFRFRVSRNFAKCKEIFAKHEIRIITKDSRNYENENFRSHPSLHRGGLSLLFLDAPSLFVLFKKAFRASSRYRIVFEPLILYILYCTICATGDFTSPPAPLSFLKYVYESMWSISNNFKIFLQVGEFLFIFAVYLLIKSDSLHTHVVRYHIYYRRYQTLQLSSIRKADDMHFFLSLFNCQNEILTLFSLAKDCYTEIKIGSFNSIW